MNKQFTYSRSKAVDMRKLYIAAQPNPTKEIRFETLDDDDSWDSIWLDKARRLQARRWRKIKNQVI